MGRRLTTLHGFTQNQRCWGRFGTLLAESWEVEHLDLPGHGDAGDVTSTDLVQAARWLSRQRTPTTWLGYSMGGRVALHVAAESPDVVDGLVLVGATPGIIDADVRAARRTDDLRRARAIVTDGLDAFLNDWLAGPMFAALSDEDAHLSERRRNSATGLAAALTTLGTGTQQPLWDRLPHLTTPLLVLTGGNDRRFSDIGAAMVDTWGGPAQHVVIADAGHACHAERPEAAAAAIAEWSASMTRDAAGA